MSGDWVVRAGFLHQVQPGDRIRMAWTNQEPWLVTGRADGDSLREDGTCNQIVVLAGQDDQGNPKHEMGAGWRPVCIYHAVDQLAAADQTTDQTTDQGGAP